MDKTHLSGKNRGKKWKQNQEIVKAHEEFLRNNKLRAKKKEKMRKNKK
jgi:hypothetical protein